MAQKAVKFPIQLYGLHARYANALYAAASRNNSLKAVETDLGVVKGWLKNNATFRNYLKNPIVQRSEKKADVDKLSKGMSETTRGFLSVLAENGRLNDLDKVLATFDKLIDADRGIVKATVTSAEPLTAQKLKSIEQQLSSTFLAKGQTLQLEAKVEPAILGGLQVQVGDKFVDLSVASKINEVSKALSAQSA